MTKLIAKRKELLALSDVTNRFEDIVNCGQITIGGDPKKEKLRFLEKYEALMKEIWPDEDYQEILRKAGYKSWKEIHGFVFGETFFNGLLVMHGPEFGIQWERYATKAEDYNGGDAFGTKFDGEETEELILQHKMFHPNRTVKLDDLPGLGWAPLIYKPVLVTTAWDATYHIKDRIEERGGSYILRQDILEFTENPNFWNNYAEQLSDNVTAWKQITKKAEEEAEKESNVPLEDWQAVDLKTLKENDAGVFIGPPGSGKTRIEAKLIEHWMMEEGE